MPTEAFTRRPVARLSRAQRSRRGTAVGLVILAALWLTATGCNSIYHRTQKELPPEPSAQLSMRVQEARRAENLTTQAGTRLHDDFARHLPGETIQADLDRLEVAALDLRRRTTTARDLAVGSKEHSDVAGEIERLDLRSQAWLDYVESSRSAAPAKQLSQLDALLHGSAAPANAANQSAVKDVPIR